MVPETVVVKTTGTKAPHDAVPKTDHAAGTEDAKSMETPSSQGTPCPHCFTKPSGVMADLHPNKIRLPEPTQYLPTWKRREASISDDCVSQDEGSQEGSPVKEGDSVSPVEEGKSVSPMEEGTSVSPVKEVESVSLVEEGASVSPMEEGAYVPPNEGKRLETR